MKTRHCVHLVFDKILFAVIDAPRFRSIAKLIRPASTIFHQLFILVLNIHGCNGFVSSHDATIIVSALRCELWLAHIDILTLLKQLADHTLPLVMTYLTDFKLAYSMSQFTFIVFSKPKLNMCFISAWQVEIYLLNYQDKESPAS